MKGFMIKSTSILMYIILLMIIKESQTIKVNLCRRAKNRRDNILLPSVKVKPSTLLATCLNHFKDVEPVIAKQRLLYEKMVGPHELIIKNVGLKDFYRTTKDRKFCKLPRKRKVRILFEIQWLLTSMIYHLKVVNVLEKDFNFHKIENKVKGLAETWKLVMNRLGVNTKRRRSSCYRKGSIPKMDTRREVSKHTSIVLHDIHCALNRLIDILENCRIRKKKNKKTGVVQYVFTCGKGVKSVFYNRKFRSPKFLPNHCEVPTKLYSLWQL